MQDLRSPLLPARRSAEEYGTVIVSNPLSLSCGKLSYASAIASLSGTSSVARLSTEDKTHVHGNDVQAANRARPSSPTWLDKFRFGPFRKLSPEEQQLRQKLRQGTQLCSTPWSYNGCCIVWPDGFAFCCSPGSLRWDTA